MLHLHIPPALWKYHSILEWLSRAAWLFWQKVNRRGVCCVRRDKHSYTKPAAGLRVTAELSGTAQGLECAPAQPLELHARDTALPASLTSLGTGTQHHGFLQTWETPRGEDWGTCTPHTMPKFPRAGHSRGRECGIVQSRRTWLLPLQR